MSAYPWGSTSQVLATTASIIALVRLATQQGFSVEVDKDTWVRLTLDDEEATRAQQWFPLCLLQDLKESHWQLTMDALKALRDPRRAW